MPQCKLRSFQARTPADVEPKWYHADGDGRILGRFAVQIATVLMGKHRPTYTPHVDTGDFVVVTNVEKVRVTGRKDEEYSYPKYTYYPGGYREIPFQRVKEQHPERILMETVRRMLPKNALGRAMLSKLKAYAGPSHPHTAQQPQPWAFDHLG
ncbi:MAG: 50S ribosomal protein L13 [Phycisphaerae bacterium]|nr:50S ribosomal protein L13 [Phycisphaerae bacterium]